MPPNSLPIPKNTTLHTLHITGQITDAHDIHRTLVLALENFKIDYIFLQESPYQLFESFDSRNFHSLTYGLLAALWFEQFDPFHEALQTLTSVLRAYRAPILPHLNPTHKAPIINVGKTRLSETGEYVEDATPDPQLDALIAQLNTFAEPQLPAHYTLTKVLTTRARGSMFLMDHEGLNLPCVVKEARVGYDPTLDGHDAASRCIREAEILNHLQHLPYIPTVIEYWQTSFATFLVTPWLGERHLKTFCKAANPDRQLTALGSLLSALNQLHQLGWVWLDVKPGNVLHDNSGNWWLIDLETATQTTPEAFAPLFWASNQYWPPNYEALLTPDRAHRLDHFAFWIIALLCTGHLTEPAMAASPPLTSTAKARDAYTHFNWPDTLPKPYAPIKDILEILADASLTLSVQETAARSNSLLASLRQQVTDSSIAAVVLH